MTEIRQLKSDELHAELDRLRRHLFDLRSQAVTEKLADSSQLRKTKADIARIFTAMNERGEQNIEQRQYHMEAVATHRKGKKKS
ncbi:MAG: 50S ribosomal protein L29 [Phycisphaerae bacterium]|nr:50S ribosomal protein L29 [Phycisphaerae bacterium]